MFQNCGHRNPCAFDDWLPAADPRIDFNTLAHVQTIPAPFGNRKCPIFPPGARRIMATSQHRQQAPPAFVLLLPDILHMLPHGKSHGNQFPNLFRKTVSIKPVASARRQASLPFSWVPSECACTINQALFLPLGVGYWLRRMLAGIFVAGCCCRASLAESVAYALLGSARPHYDCLPRHDPQSIAWRFATASRPGLRRSGNRKRIFEASGLCKNIRVTPRKSSYLHFAAFIG